MNIHYELLFGIFKLDNSITSKKKYAAKLVVLLLDDVTPAVGGAAEDHLLPLPPSPLLPLLLLGCGPAGLVESNSALVAADHQDVGGVDVAEEDGFGLLDEGENLMSGILHEASWLAAADKVPPRVGGKVDKEALQFRPEQFIAQ